MSDYSGPDRRRQTMETVLWMKELEMRFTQLLADMNRMHEDNQKLLLRHDHALFGNGKTGLVQDVHDIKGMWRAAKWVIITGGAVVIVQVVQTALTWYSQSGGHG